MTALQKQVRSARSRLWLNRWLSQLGWWLVGAAAAWTLFWISCRLFAWNPPARMIALGGLGLVVLGSCISLWLTRDSDRTAAAALDRAAGLKERVSTGLCVAHQQDDPFAQAVVADADRVIAGISARKLIPLRWSGSLSLSALLLIVAALSLLLPEFDILNRGRSRAEADQKRVEMDRVRSTLAKPAAAIQRIAEANPDAELDKDAKALQDAFKREADPDVLRRETAKKLDRMEDALKSKMDAERFQALSETKNKLKQIGQPSDPKSELGRLMENIAAGEFDKAQDSLKKTREQLAKRAHEAGADKPQIEKMTKQLDELARKLEQTAQDKQTERDLENAGLSEAEIKRTLDALAKKDVKQLEKAAQELAQRLKDKGFSKEDIQKMLDKMKQRQQANQQCQKMGEKMGQAARKLEQGDTQAAQEELGQAEEMLSEMEQMEQSLNDLEGQMAELQDARDQMNQEYEPPDSRCPKCNGTGFRKDGAPCPHCDGKGQCRGANPGSGPRERDDNVQVDFQNQKVKGKDTGKGVIIGQQFVKGKQLKNQSRAELYDAARAAEIDAADALEKDRIPRVYRRGVKRYFDRLGEDFSAQKQPPPAPGANSQPPAKPAP